MIATMSGGHDPFSSRPDKTSCGIEEVAVVRTTDRGTAKSSSSSSRSWSATGQSGQRWLLADESGTLPTPRPASSSRKSANPIFAESLVSGFEANHSVKCVEACKKESVCSDELPFIFQSALSGTQRPAGGKKGGQHVRELVVGVM
jgi:hypothetical protein